MRYLAAYFLAHQLLYILQQGLKAENIIGIYVWIYNTPQIQNNNFAKYTLVLLILPLSFCFKKLFYSNVIKGERYGNPFCGSRTRR